MTLYLVLVAATVLTTIGVSYNLHRARKQLSFTLKPNCLLTQFPIAFITGQRTLLHFLEYWNHLPALLNEHGYQTHVFQLPWRKNIAQIRELKKKIYNLKDTKIHLFADQSLVINLKDLAPDQKIASITLLVNPADQKESNKSDNLNTAYPIYYLPLDHTSRPQKSAIERILLSLHTVLIFPQRPLPALMCADGLDSDMSDKILNHVIYLAEQDFLLESNTTSARPPTPKGSLSKTQWQQLATDP